MAIELPQHKHKEKGEKLYHLYTPRQPEIEKQVVAILGMTFLQVSASYCAGRTNMATQQKT